MRAMAGDGDAVALSFNGSAPILLTASGVSERRRPSDDDDPPRNRSSGSSGGRGTVPGPRDRTPLGYLVRENPWSQLQICGAAQKDKNNVIAATLNRLTNKADTSGRITNTLGDGP